MNCSSFDQKGLASVTAGVLGVRSTVCGVETSRVVFSAFLVTSGGIGAVVLTKGGLCLGLVPPSRFAAAERWRPSGVLLL